MDKLNRDNQPFHTDNALLAFCLWRAGVEFWEPNAPCLVLYDADIIRNIKNANGESIFKGMTLEDAVRKAHSNHQRGHITYIFRPDEHLMKLLHAFREQEIELRNETVTVESIVKGVIERWKDGTISDPEALLRLAYIDLKTRPQFMEMWHSMIPHIRIMNRGEVTTSPTTRGGQIVNYPGYKIMSINASQKLREELGV